MTGIILSSSSPVPDDTCPEVIGDTDPMSGVGVTSVPAAVARSIGLLLSDIDLLVEAIGLYLNFKDLSRGIGSSQLQGYGRSSVDGILTSTLERSLLLTRLVISIIPALIFAALEAVNQFEESFFADGAWTINGAMTDGPLLHGLNGSLVEIRSEWCEVHIECGIGTPVTTDRSNEGLNTVEA